jgi:hypothetical protein
LTQNSYNLKGSAIYEEGMGIEVRGETEGLGSLRTTPLFHPITILVLVKNSLRTLQECYELGNIHFDVSCCMAFHVFAGVCLCLENAPECCNISPLSLSTHHNQKTLSMVNEKPCAYCSVQFVNNSHAKELYKETEVFCGSIPAENGLMLTVCLEGLCRLT